MADIVARHRIPLIVALLTLMVILPYARSYEFSFVDYDDNQYITENPIVLDGLTWRGVKWAFTTTAASNWHPLTWLSHMVDCEWYRRADGTQWAGGHHLTNLAIHMGSTFVLFALLNRMTRRVWRSALVAALFAVHPLHVESVAWAAERKDVLSTFLGFLAIWSYAGYVKRPRIWRYLIMAGLFALSLLAKPMLVTLPCVLMLLDFWPLRRLSGHALPIATEIGAKGALAGTMWIVLEKLPLLALSAASSAMTIWAQSKGGAIFPLESLPFEQRVANAAVAYAAYIGKMFWPDELVVLYPHPGHWPAWQFITSLAIVLVISAGSIALSRKRPWLLVGWLWYLGTLVPVIGLLQVGLQSMADRYTYVPLIGLFIMMAWSLPDLRNRLHHTTAVVAMVLAIIALTARSIVQAGYWRDSFTLFNRTLDVTSRNFIIANNLGYAYNREGEIERAVHCFTESLNMNPNYAVAHDNLGNALNAQGRIGEAIEQYDIALRLKPESARTHHNLGSALLKQGRFDEAIAGFQAAIKLDNDLLIARIGLGMVLVRQKKFELAIAEYEQVLARDPNSAEAHSNMGLALAQQKRWDEAITKYEDALRVRPDFAEAHANMGLALASQGLLDRAIAKFRDALRIDPNSTDAAKYLDTALKQRASTPTP